MTSVPSTQWASAARASLPAWKTPSSSASTPAKSRTGEQAHRSVLISHASFDTCLYKFGLLLGEHTTLRLRFVTLNNYFFQTPSISSLRSCLKRTLRMRSWPPPPWRAMPIYWRPSRLWGRTTSPPHSEQMNKHDKAFVFQSLNLLVQLELVFVTFS